jgi:hypothetical protein
LGFSSKSSFSFNFFFKDWQLGKNRLRKIENMVKLKKLYFQGQLGTKLKNTKTKDQVKKTHLNLGVFFKLCKGGN